MNFLFSKWFPTSYLIDREGRILICHVGFKAGDEDVFEKEITAALMDKGAVLPQNNGHLSKIVNISL